MWDGPKYLTHVSKEETEGQGGPATQLQRGRAGLSPGVTPRPTVTRTLDHRFIKPPRKRTSKMARSPDTLLCEGNCIQGANLTGHGDLPLLKQHT